MHSRLQELCVSRIERAEDTQLSTISRYVKGLGGHLELRAIFDDEQTVALALPAINAAVPGA